MDLMKDLEEIAGAVAAVEGIKKVDPNAGFITEAAAAIKVCLVNFRTAVGHRM